MLYGSANFSDGALEAFYNMFAEQFGETYDKSKMPCNKPRATPDHPSKSHIVKACYDDKEKLIRFGQQGVKGSPKKEEESDAYRKRRESFKDRHAKNIAKGKSSAAYWSNVWKWVEDVKW
jgi:hypothetical protein